MINAPHGFRIVGSCRSERRSVEWRAAFSAYAACDEKAKFHNEAYLSGFTFDDTFRTHLKDTGSVKGYTGSCGAVFLWWDIDREGDLEAARNDAVKLTLEICTRYTVVEDDMLAFFSGSKGFHLGLPVSLWEPPPSKNFHKITKRFCSTIADEAGVVIDVGIYDAVRAFRAPNSRHPKTGLHKRRLSVDELTHLSVDEIIEMAKTPEPFEVPTPPSGRCNPQLADDWKAATEYVRNEAEAQLHRHANPADFKALNRLTTEFIRDGANVGERQLRLFSAAANLGEFSCPPVLAHALLTESARDSGLPPNEVRRTIEGGLETGLAKIKKEGDT